MSAPRVCLNMIVRNEAAIIERCLTAALPAIDYYVICDTGSTDDTVARMRKVLDAAGTAGEIHHTEFRDFGSARNEALDRCRQSAGAFDYILFADADLELRILDADFRALLEAPAYIVRQTTREHSFFNTRLMRRDLQARYVGMTHEYLRAGWPLPRFDALAFDDHACGSSRPEKFERDLRLLLQELERDPQNPRTLFYIAQTYRSHGDDRTAIEWYRRRATAGGWDEEIWYSLYAAALCHNKLGEEQAFIDTALEAYRVRPSRAEPLYALARHYRDQRLYEEAFTMAEMGAAIPYPHKDALFVRDFVYKYGLTEEISIAGYYSWDPARYAAGRAACASLMTREDIPEFNRETARRNWEYYAQKD